MRKRGLPESREVETSRQIAMENQAIKSLMQRYRIRDKAEAEELFDRMGGLKEYRKMFNMVEADDYQSNRDRIAALLAEIRRGGVVDHGPNDVGGRVEAAKILEEEER